jgi:hypothetical protein
MNARELSLKGLDAMAAADRVLWLSYFEDDAVLEDPVGPSDWDPAGVGHHGIEAIARFYDNVCTKNKRFSYIVRESYLCGDEVASALTFDLVSWDDVLSQVSLITVHRMSRNGKFASIRAFWDFSAQG